MVFSYYDFVLIECLFSSLLRALRSFLGRFNALKIGFCQI